MIRIILIICFTLLAQLAGAVDLPRAGAPWTNSLGMVFVPASATNVLFSIWETRNQDFAAFVDETKYDATAGAFSLGPDGWKDHHHTWLNPGFSTGLKHPVCAVSWEDAQAFGAWLTKKEQAAGRLRTNQCYRLPTDAEWSLAAGLGPETGKTPKDKSEKIPDVYPWGTQWPPPHDAGNFAGVESKPGTLADWQMISQYDDGFPRTAPVGRFAPNQFGLFDLAGNVWEWCDDLVEPVAAWQGRCLRGGSWANYEPNGLLSSCRACSPPGMRRTCNGFRCVIDTVAPRPATP